MRIIVLRFFAHLGHAVIQSLELTRGRDLLIPQRHQQRKEEARIGLRMEGKL